jgi:polysaccharide pyruvyl transferase WcaK-like protein
MTSAPRRNDAAPRRIALFGIFGVDNFGNEASLDAALRFMRRELPNVELTCICTTPSKVTRDHRLNAIPIAWKQPTNTPRPASFVGRLLRKVFRSGPAEVAIWYQTYRQVRQFEAVIFPGTGILDDFCIGPWSTPYDLFRWCVVARLAGVKTLFVSVGAGPIDHPLSRTFMKAAARVAQYRSYRDQVSKDFMGGIGLDTERDPVYPDIVFALDERPAESSAVEAKRLTVGVGLMWYHGWKGRRPDNERIYDDYIKKIVSFVGWLINNQYKVRLLLGDLEDRPAADLVFSMLKAQGIDVSPQSVTVAPVQSFADVASAVAQTDIVVATRFHNVVCGLLLNKPVLAIGYAKKSDVLMADMGLGEYCQHIERLDVAKLIEQFNRLVIEGPMLRQRLAIKNQEYRQRLKEQFDFLLRHYLARHAPAGFDSGRAPQTASLGDRL